MDAIALLVTSLAWVISDHFPPWTSFHSELPAFAATVLALGGCIYASRKGGERFKLPAAVILPAFLLLTVVVQWFFGKIVYRGDALVASVYLVTFSIAWTWGYHWASGERAAELLQTVSTILLMGGLIASWQVLAQWLLVEENFYGWVLDARTQSKPTGNLGQPNLTGTLLLMASVSAAILMARKKLGFSVFVALLLWFGWAIVLTQSRTAFLSAAVLSVCFFCLNYPDRVKRWRSALVFLWLVYLLLAGLLLQQLSAIDMVADAKQGVGVGSMVTAGGRPLLWTQLLLGLVESPWSGYGWLQVSSAHQVGAVQLAGAMQTNYAHNAVLDLMLMVGLPIGLLVMGVTARWIYRRVPAILKNDNAVQAIFILLPFLVHTQLELPHACAYFLVPAGLLLGAVDAWTCPSAEKGWHVSIVAAMAFAVAWSALLLAVAYEYMLAEEDYRVNRFENRRLGKTPDDYQAPNLKLLTQLDEMLKSMRLRADRNMRTEDLDILKRASQRYVWAPLEYRTALALALNNQPREAEKYLMTIKTMFPPDVYEEGRTNWLQMQKEKYPELGSVRWP